MNNFSIKTISAEEAVEKSEAITKLYADVFAAPPWNEAFKCTICKKSFGRQNGDCECCGKILEEYYPFERTKEEIEQCFQLTRARVAILLNSKDIAGFAWGWEDSLENLNSEKLNLEELDLSEVKNKSNYEDKDAVFYFSEFGVKTELRGKGLGKKLHNELFSSIDRNSAKGILMRTSTFSPAFSIVTKSENYPMQIIYSYKDKVDRVILSQLDS